MKASLEIYMDEQLEQLKRSEMLESLGHTENAKSIDKEWEGSSLMETQWLSVDCFVRN